MKYIRYGCFALAALVLFGCQSAPPVKQETAFYYWQSSFELSDASIELLERTNAKRLFVKYLDVDLENGIASPVAPVRFIGDSHQAYEIVPCVFITNRTFEAENGRPEQLAGNVWSYLQQINEQAGIRPTEYQFDCDWTAATRQAYFAFLNKINELKGEATLSSTLRLHQYRYPDQAGIPPVDKVALMYYNMGDIEDVGESNSILNNEKGFPYLGKQEYPLKMDVALPVFSWILVYRLGKLEKIIKAATPDSLTANKAVEKTGENTFLIKQNLYFGGHYLNEGDRLRYEESTADDLEAAAHALNKIENQSGTLLFYHLDEKLPGRYPSGFFRRIAGLYFQ